MEFSVHRSIRKSAGNAAPQRRPLVQPASEQSKGRLTAWLRKSLLPALSILIGISFAIAAAGLIIGLLAGNYELVGLVFWLLPRLGFAALVVLLVRFVTTTEMPSQRAIWKAGND
ncbi:MAG: hypothetical protein WBN04_07620 [Paracoccaceae bacterium]